MAFDKVLSSMDKSIEKFMKRVPAAQRRLLETLEREINRLDLDSNGNVKPSVRNLNVLAKIKAKLQSIIITPEYEKMVKEFTGSFDGVTKQLDASFKQLDSRYKPKTITKQIKKQAKEDTVRMMTESGLAATVVDEVTEVLRQNVTTGGSYKQLTKQFKELLTDTGKGDGILNRYARQIVTDSVNQYAAQYTQIISADFNAEWFSYAGADKTTTRPFCDAMTDIRQFHITEVPGMLKANNLYYTDKKTNEKKKVPLNAKTGLPAGMIPETNAENFFIRRGGYNCGHQIRPITIHVVTQATKDRVFPTSAYKQYQRQKEK